MESFYSVDGKVNWCGHYGKQYGLSLKKLKVELLYDAGIPCSRENKEELSFC